MRNGRRAALRTLSLCLAAALPALAAAQTPCPPPQQPPAVPATLLSPNTGWSSMAAFMADQNIQFVASSGSQQVIPCNPTYCAPMVARVVSEQRTLCLTSAMASGGQIFIAGVVVRVSGGAPSQQLGFGPPNATDSVYLLVQSNHSIAMFRGVNGKVNIIHQNVAQKQGWDFLFHPELGPFPTPQAEWRGNPRRVSMAGGRARPPVRGGGPTDLLPADEGGDAQGGTSYAWMACAAGCCQFHGLPAGSGENDGDEDDDDQGHPTPHPRPRPRMNVQKDGGAPTAP